MIGNVINLDLGEIKRAIEEDIAAEVTREVKNNFLNNMHPIGSIYLSMNSTDPETLFGGKWEAIAKGKTLVGVDVDSDNVKLIEAGIDFGEAEHTLTIEEMPSHKHRVYCGWQDDKSSEPKLDTIRYGQNRSNYYKDCGVDTDIQFIESVGGGEAHNNYQPSFTCYIWKRVE